MLKLSSPAREPFWLDLDIKGVPLRVRVKPITPAMMIVARRKVSDFLKDEGAAEGAEANSRAAAVLVRALAQLGIVEWDGVGGEDGEAAAVTPENVDRFMSLLPVFDAVDRLYVDKALTLDVEGNGSSSSRAGILKATARSTAKAAA